MSKQTDKEPIHALEPFSDEALREEIRVREEKRRVERRGAIETNRHFVSEFADTLLLFVPKHDRTSCSDKKACNSGRQTGRMRCKRCELLRVVRNRKTLDNSDVTVYLEVKFEEEP